MLQKLWRSEPVVGVALVLFLVMLVQKIWLGEVITEAWVEWVLSILGLATGTVALRSAVYSKKTVEGESLSISDHNE